MGPILHAGRTPGIAHRDGAIAFRNGLARGAPEE
jgi:hypothetical protein